MNSYPLLNWGDVEAIRHHMHVSNQNTRDIDSCLASLAAHILELQKEAAALRAEIAALKPPKKASKKRVEK